MKSIILILAFAVSSVAQNNVASAPFITKTPTTALSSEFPLSSLPTGILKNTTGTGIPTIAIPGVDYMLPGTASNIVVREIAVNSTLGGDIEKILSIPTVWNPSSGGGDFNALWIEAVAVGPATKSSVYGANIFLDAGGTGATSRAFGIQDIVVSRATTTGAASFETHGYNGVSTSYFYGGQFELFNPPNARTTFSVGVESDQRGGVNGVTDGSFGFLSILDTGGNTRFLDHAAFDAHLELATGTIVDRWTGFRVDTLPVSATATASLGLAIGLDIEDMVAAQTNYAIRTGQGLISLGTLKNLTGAPGKRVVCVDPLSGVLYTSASTSECN